MAEYQQATGFSSLNEYENVGMRKSETELLRPVKPKNKSEEMIHHNEEIAHDSLITLSISQTTALI